MNKTSTNKFCRKNSFNNNRIPEFIMKNLPI